MLFDAQTRIYKSISMFSLAALQRILNRRGFIVITTIIIIILKQPLRFKFPSFDESKANSVCTGSHSHSKTSLIRSIIVVLQMKLIKWSQYARLVVRWTLLVRHRECWAVTWLNAYCHPPSTIQTAFLFLVEYLLTHRLEGMWLHS